jgi:hypothetical protein
VKALAVEMVYWDLVKTRRKGSGETPGERDLVKHQEKGIW